MSPCFHNNTIAVIFQQFSEHTYSKFPKYFQLKIVLVSVQKKDNSTICLCFVQVWVQVRSNSWMTDVMMNDQSYNLVHTRNKQGRFPDYLKKCKFKRFSLNRYFYLASLASLKLHQLRAILSSICACLTTATEILVYPKIDFESYR